MKLKVVSMALILVGAAALSACGLSTVQGSGEVVTQEREVSGFDEVVLSGFGEVFLTQGASESLSIEADSNLLSYIVTEVRDGKLYIEFERETLLVPTERITYRLSVVNLVGVQSSGAGLFEIDSLDTPSLDINFSGAGRIAVDSLTADALSVDTSGVGEVELAGEVGSQQVSISGAGRYSAPDLKSGDARVSISGLGSVVVWAVDSLDVHISGGGKVEYYGSPEVTQDIEGGGSIQRLGDK
jgi:hypothetical protein